MPKQTLNIDVPELEANTILLYAFATLQRLGWTVRRTGADFLIANTPGTWNYLGQEIEVRVNNSSMSVTSRMVQGQIVDLKGTNKKRVAGFATAFEETRSSATSDLTVSWQNELDALRREKSLLESEEPGGAEQGMNLGQGRIYLTYAIIGINVLVFILMLVGGVSFIEPTGQDIVDWGGSFKPLVSAGEWWRIITCVFVHIGIIHLLFNMYALYMIGIYLEPMLGRTKFIIAYLSTGVLASLGSLWWNDSAVVSAGASGAIFGMYGLFLALLSTNLISKLVRNQMFRSIGIFVGYNLLFGLKSGVDNAAHIGGLISGILIGFLFYFDLRKKENQPATFKSPLVVSALTIIIAFIYLNDNRSPFNFKDQDSFSRTMEHFASLEELALEAMQSGDTTTKEVYLDKLKKTALADWVHCVNLFEETKELNLDSNLANLRETMLTYSNHRVNQTVLYIKSVEEDSDQYDAGIDSIQKKIDQIFIELQKMKSLQPE